MRGAETPTAELSARPSLGYRVVFSWVSYNQNQVITLANDKHTQYSEPIKTLSNYR